MNNIKEALKYAKENTIFYKNIDIDNIINNSILTKKTYIENSYPYSNNMLTNLNEAKYVFSTSGTTSKPQYIIRNSKDIDYQINDYIGLDINKNDVILNLFWGGIWGVYTTNNLVLSKTEATIIPYGGNNIKDLNQLDIIIKDLNVNALFGVPSTILHIAQYYEDKKEIPDIRKVFCLGEKMDEITYNYIRSIFKNVIIKTKYGCMESAGIGYQCKNINKNQYHIFENRYVEIIDKETNKECNEKEIGKIIVTTLDKRLVPLVRYDTGDIGYIEKTKCECGCNEILTILSRDNDEFIVASVHLSKNNIKKIIENNSTQYKSHNIVVSKKNNMDHIEINIYAKDFNKKKILEQLYNENPDLYDIIKDKKINEIDIILKNNYNINITSGKIKNFLDRR